MLLSYYYAEEECSRFTQFHWSVSYFSTAAGEGGGGEENILLIGHRVRLTISYAW